MTQILASIKALKRGIAKMGYSSWSETVKHVIDGVSVMTAVGTLTKMLPAVAAIFTIVWTGIRIYESNTVQRFLKKDAKHGE
jgi:hypothetical protein